MVKRSTSRAGSIRARNQARILVAAEAVFAETGFHGATTAAIAERAKLPKANLHYYFGTKRALYRAVLTNILDLWLGAFDAIEADRRPADALGDYIRDKMYWSRTKPNASKVFANEILHGAPQLGGYLASALRRRVQQKAAVLKHWARRGLIDPVDPVHLVFTLWAMTQHYADFEVQVRAVLGRKRLTDADFNAATTTIVKLVLDGCGVARSSIFAQRGEVAERGGGAPRLRGWRNSDAASHASASHTARPPRPALARRPLPVGER